MCLASFTAFVQQATLIVKEDKVVASRVRRALSRTFFNGDPGGLGGRVQRSPYITAERLFGRHGGDYGVPCRCFDGSVWRLGIFPTQILCSSAARRGVNLTQQQRHSQQQRRRHSHGCRHSHCSDRGTSTD